MYVLWLPFIGTLKIHSFNTQNVINMENMFYQSESLEFIDYSKY